PRRAGCPRFGGSRMPAAPSGRSLDTHPRPGRGRASGAAHRRRRSDAPRRKIQMEALPLKPSSCLTRTGGENVRAAVVGHVEWAEFAEVERLPRPGEIIDAKAMWGEAAGGGAGAAGQLLKLAGSVDFYVVIGNDDLGRRTLEALEEMGLHVHAVVRDEPQRRVFTFVDAEGERTITTLGDKLHPHGADDLAWDELAEIDVVYFSAGDADALRAARQARVLVATARELRTLREAAVRIDALVRSGRDPGEGYEPGLLDPEPRMIVSTMGREGGRYIAGDE